MLQYIPRIFLTLHVQRRVNFSKRSAASFDYHHNLALPNPSDQQHNPWGPQKPTLRTDHNGSAHDVLTYRTLLLHSWRVRFIPGVYKYAQAARPSSRPIGPHGQSLRQR